MKPRTSFLRITSPAVLGFLMLLMSFISGCSHQPRVTQDFKPGTDFTHYKTFAVRQMSVDVENADSKLITELLTQTLIQRGLKLDATNPDLLIDANVLKQTSSGAQSAIGIGIGIPLGRHASFGINTQKLLGGGNNQSALLIIDITDNHEHQIIWRGNANEFPVSYFFARNQAQLRGIIEELLLQFPPKP